MSKKIKKARKVMRKAFDLLPHFEYGYVANVAMLLHDFHGVDDIDKANDMALDVLDLIFRDQRGSNAKVDRNNGVVIREKPDPISPTYWVSPDGELGRVDEHGDFILGYNIRLGPFAKRDMSSWDVISKKDFCYWREYDQELVRQHFFPRNITKEFPAPTSSSEFKKKSPPPPFDTAQFSIFGEKDFEEKIVATATACKMQIIHDQENEIEPRLTPSTYWANTAAQVGRVDRFGYFFLGNNSESTPLAELVLMLWSEISKEEYVSRMTGEPRLTEDKNVIIGHAPATKWNAPVINCPNIPDGIDFEAMKELIREQTNDNDKS